mmetsp:Transcript_9409/g.9211  ORF Transcript_9409/g.9211 Transcript_9409/m.9211 type:complete len:114 (-) Transcript_9409:13-354(-)
MKTRSIKIRQLKCSRITDRIATKIAHFGSSLQRFSIQDLDMLGVRRKPVLTDTGIVKLLQKCPNLHTLELYDCHDITDTSIVKIAECCPTIHTLDLRGCWKITDSSIVMLVEK